MKILCISDAWHPQTNGVVTTYENIGRALRAQGHEFFVIGPSDFRYTMALFFYPEIRLALFAFFTLAQKISATGADVIHIATEGPLGWAARRYCLRRKIPFTTSYHTHFPDYLAARMPACANFVHALTTSILRRFHAPAEVTFTATKSLAKLLTSCGHRQCFIPLGRGADPALFHDVISRDLFSDLPRPVALYVGRVAVEKNICAFLDATWSGSKVVIGDGPDLLWLKQRYPSCHFKGARFGSELADFYRSADIFAFPSRTDTFGIVLLEALACGLPVAAFPVQGPLSIIADKRLGSLHDDFPTAMRNALQAPGTRAERHAYVTMHYGWDKAADDFLSGLRRLRLK